MGSFQAHDLFGCPQDIRAKRALVRTGAAGAGSGLPSGIDRERGGLAAWKSCVFRPGRHDGSAPPGVEGCGGKGPAGGHPPGNDHRGSQGNSHGNRRAGGNLPGGGSGRDRRTAGSDGRRRTGTLPRTDFRLCQGIAGAQDTDCGCLAAPGKYCGDDRRRGK